MITLATALSRVTGFLRVVAAAAAMGTTFLANTYQSANTAPNLVFELFAAGVLTSVFVPTFVDHLVRGEREQSWAAANVLTSVALVALVAIASVVAIGAPWLMRLFLLGVDDPQQHAATLDLGTRFLRLFAPQVVFYGAGMIMTAALHAHRRFTMAALAPILNNLVVIGVYLSYASMRSSSDVRVGAISDAEVMLLGLGTSAGVVAMTICLIPSLRKLGWRYRFRFDLSHPAVKRGARLGIWALSYAGGYQAGLIVVLILANRIAGGVAAYQWAYTYFYLPHALFGVPIFHVLFTAMSEHVSRGERSALVDRLRDGLGMLWFILVPVAVGSFVLAEPLARATLEYGAMTPRGTQMVARTLAAFSVGLPTFSTFLVLTRAFYALSDTKTPALANLATVAVASLCGLLAFELATDPWAVPGLAAGHSVGALFGCLLLGRALSSRLGSFFVGGLRASLSRSLVAGVPTALVMWVGVGFFDPQGRAGSLLACAVVAALGGATYALVSKMLGAPELDRLWATGRSLFKRAP